MAAILAEMQAM
jgi:hypothetical protein